MKTRAVAEYTLPANAKGTIQHIGLRPGALSTGKSTASARVPATRR
jgi:hypothetical protein